MEEHQALNSQLRMFSLRLLRYDVDDDDNDKDDEDDDDDVYIMMKCMCVCLFVTFLLILSSPAKLRIYI